jgi:RimJ/RimL family protein N-acetyltransferase
VRLIPFVPAHAEALLADDLNEGCPEIVDDWSAWIGDLVNPDMAFTGIENGHLVGSAGLIKIWPGVSEAWFVGSWRLNNNVMAGARATRRKLDELMKAHELHRIQAVVRADWPTARRFARYLGMKDEGVMKQYGSDRMDYMRVAKTITMPKGR